METVNKSIGSTGIWTYTILRRVVMVVILVVLMTGLNIPQQVFAQDEISTVRLADVQMRDAHVLADEETGTYYIVSSARGPAVRAYKSTDLVDWEGPYIVYETPDEMWGTDVHINNIWAPELHKYNGRYYLFVTFNTNHPRGEQWEDWFEWRTRVLRGSQVLVSDDPLGPYEAFSNEPQLTPEMMTLDGTLWEEDGIPYMVYCHEWVQIVDGGMSKVQLSEDLSSVVGDYKVLFRGSEAAWNRPGEPTHWVTDGPWLYESISGKLFMVWSGFSHTGYTVGLAVSESGKLAGPWVQQDEPLYSDDGGHPMLFTTFDGELMMALHSPNSGPDQRTHFFEMEDTGETLRIIQRFTPE